MKTIIAGSRNLPVDGINIDWFIKKSGFEITKVISGTAKGVDIAGEQWANMNNIPIWRFPADWDQYGKRAGYLRNQQMADVADALIAIWDGESKGTKHMIDIALRSDLHIFIYNTKTKMKIWYNDPLKGTE